MTERAGTDLPLLLSLASSSLASMAASILAMVLVSDFGMIRDMLYFGVPPLMDFGSQTFA